MNRPPELTGTLFVSLSARRSSRRGWHALALALLLGAAVVGGIPAPARAQEPTLRCMGGERLPASDLKHGVAILVVWASWSPRSQDIEGRIRAIHGHFGGQARVVAVNYQEEAGAVRDFIKGRDFGAPVCLDTDGEFSKSYDIATLPGLLILKSGQAVFHGRLPDDAEGVIARYLR
jgi:hypothetical protein